MSIGYLDEVMSIFFQYLRMSNAHKIIQYILVFCIKLLWKNGIYDIQKSFFLRNTLLFPK